jgi:hypothetical protein
METTTDDVSAAQLNFDVEVRPILTNIEHHFVGSFPVRDIEGDGL